MAAEATADVNDASFGFEIVVHIGEEEALALFNESFEIEGAAGVGEIERLDFLVERLMIGIRAVDEDEKRAGSAVGLAPVGFGSGGNGRGGGSERIKVLG